MGPRAEPERRTQQGFTLLEMLTVVAILGILAVFAMPGILRFLRFYEINGAASQVATEIQTARAQAIKRNANWGVVFFVVSANEYRLYSEDVPNDPTAAAGSAAATLSAARQDLATAQARGVAGPVRTLPRGIEFAPPGGGTVIAAVRFDRLGRVCKVGTSADCPATAATLSPSATLIGGAPTPLPPGVQADDLVITLRKADQTGLTRLVRINPAGRVRAQQ